MDTSKEYIRRLDMYRPDDWEKQTIKYLGHRGTDFEKGADAMLEALKKKGWRQYQKSNGNIFPLVGGNNPKSNGTLVFIPDE